MKLVVGLGNPGTKYQRTRHNLGFLTVDALAAKLSVDLSLEKFHAWFSQGELGGEKLLLAKPTTFMNRSGQAVLAIVQFYKLTAADLLVIYDDMALPLGKLRLRAGGSPGGHNGIADICTRLGTEEIPRLRLGISAATWDATSHVLSEFGAEEWPEVLPAIQRAVEATCCWAELGLTTAMNRYNLDNPAAPGGS
ncbi:MAG: Peptidyl-tRNA hydrolase [Phycisphaerae bacterium]|nr:Peptidyl-tRNA hydrolase [Phycisphaerae bacterium]